MHNWTTDVSRRSCDGKVKRLLKPPIILGIIVASKQGMKNGTDYFSDIDDFGGIYVRFVLITRSTRCGKGNGLCLAWLGDDDVSVLLHTTLT